MVLLFSHGMNLMDQRVVVHMQRGGGFACEVSDPITELIVTNRDEAALLAIQGVINEKLGVAAVAVIWEACKLYDVVQKEGVTPLLIPHLRSIHCGRKNSDPGPRLGSPYQPMGIQCRGFHHGLLQFRLFVLHVTATDFPSDLPQEHGMVPEFELCPTAEICNQVSCDDTRDPPVLPDRHIPVWNCQTCLFDGQTGDPSQQDSCNGVLKRSERKDLSKSSSTRWNTSMMYGVMLWKNPTPDVGTFTGHPELSADSSAPPQSQLEFLIKIIILVILYYVLLMEM